MKQKREKTAFKTLNRKTLKYHFTTNTRYTFYQLLAGDYKY